MRQRTLLAADTPSGIQTLRNVFEPAFAIAPATTIAEATGHLGGAIDAIICGIHFDESRMFDLLRLVKAHSETRDVPFLCYRDLESDLGSTVLEGLEIATKALGAAAFIDVFTLKQRRGIAVADEELCRIVEGLLLGRA